MLLKLTIMMNLDFLFVEVQSNATTENIVAEEANIGVSTEDNHIERFEDMSLESAENDHNLKECGKVLTENCFEDEENSIGLVESDERDDSYPNIMEEISPVRRNSVYKPKPRIPFKPKFTVPKRIKKPKDNSLFKRYPLCANLLKNVEKIQAKPIEPKLKHNKVFASKTKVDSGLVSALPDKSVTKSLSQNENRPILEKENSTKTISDEDAAAVRDSESNSGKERVSSVSASYPDTSQHANDLVMRYQCDFCKITYKQLKSLKNHICNKKFVKIPCLSCSKMISKSNLSHHMKTHSAIKHKCHKCKKIFRRKELLDVHILKHGRKKKTLCQQCGKVFARPNHLKAHMISHAKQQEVDQVKK
jgi:hypothetical protein